MKTVTETIRLYLTAGMNIDNDEFSILTVDMSEYGHVVVAKKDIEVSMEVPEDFDYESAKIQTLEEKKKKIGAEAQVKINNIEEQIQSLLSIEHKESGNVS